MVGISKKYIYSLCEINRENDGVTHRYIYILNN